MDRERNTNPVDFPCSYLFRAYYAETIEGVTLPNIESADDQLTELKQRLEALDKNIKNH